MSAHTCNYKVPAEPLGQRECGQPATHWRNGRGGQFYYCENHAREADDRTRGKHNITKIPEELLSRQGTDSFHAEPQFPL